MKKLYLVIISAILLSAPSYAFENHLGLGLNIDTYKDDFPSNLELKDDIGFAPTLGLKSIFFWGNVGLRTGAFFEWKTVNVEDKAGAGGKDEIDLTAYYAAIPINLQFNLNDSWSIFGGIKPRILLAKTCEDCGTFDDDSNYLVNYWNAGISYKFGESFSMDVSFNNATAENFENLKINTAQVLLFWKL